MDLNFCYTSILALTEVYFVLCVCVLILYCIITCWPCSLFDVRKNYVIYNLLMSDNCRLSPLHHNRDIDLYITNVEPVRV